MAHEYVFRGEREPYAPSPEDQRAREQAKREAARLVDRAPPAEDLSADAEIRRKIGDYQVGGLDAFGARSTPPAWERGSGDGAGTDEHTLEQTPPAAKQIQSEARS